MIHPEETHDLSYLFYNVVSNNGVHIGTFDCGDDGFWHFWPDRTKVGYWTEELLAAIAADLKKLNEPLRKQIEKDLGGET